MEDRRKTEQMRGGQTGERVSDKQVDVQTMNGGWVGGWVDE